MLRRHWLRIGTLAWLFALISFLLLPSVLGAAQAGLQEKFRGGESVIIPANQVVPHDLYVSGSQVRVDGRIQGDLIVAGGQVQVNGPVEGDLMAAGGNLTLTGPVGGDARVAGGEVLVAGSILEDLLAGAGRLVIAPTARIEQDLIFGAGQTEVAGSIGGAVYGSTGEYHRSGLVGGTEVVTIQEQPETVVAEPTLGALVLNQLRRYLGLLIVGGLLLWLAPRAVAGASTAVREEPLPSLGVGLLAVGGWLAVLIGLLLAMIILAVPLGLLGLGALTATVVLATLTAIGVLVVGFVAAVLFVAEVVVGFAVGRFLLKPLVSRWSERGVAALALGALLLVLATAVPVLGAVIRVVAVLVGLGGVALMTRRAIQSPTPARFQPSGPVTHGGVFARHPLGEARA